jgi:hypothetical protein
MSKYYIFNVPNEYYFTFRCIEWRIQFFFSVISFQFYKLKIILQIFTLEN